MPESNSPKQLLESITVHGKSIFAPENKEFLEQHKDDKWIQFLVKTNQLLNQYKDNQLLDIVLKEHIINNKLSPVDDFDPKKTFVGRQSSGKKVKLAAQTTDANLINNTLELAISEITPKILAAEQEADAKKVEENKNKKPNFLDRAAAFFSNLFKRSSESSQNESPSSKKEFWSSIKSFFNNLFSDTKKNVKFKDDSKLKETKLYNPENNEPEEAAPLPDPGPAFGLEDHEIRVTLEKKPPKVTEAPPPASILKKTPPKKPKGIRFSEAPAGSDGDNMPLKPVDKSKSKIKPSKR